MSNFTDLFIKRPVLSIVLSLIILLVGMVSYSHLPLRLFPNVDPAVISVKTSYDGASASLMEGFVTTPIESSLSGIDGIDYINSSSEAGSSTVTVQFKLGYDMNTALTDINSAVSSARWKLPEDISDPVITKSDPDSMPIMWIAFTDEQMNAEEITDYLQRVIQPQIQTTDGVAQIMIAGSREYAMRIKLDPYKMSSHHVTMSDVKNALLTNNLQTAAGSIESKDESYEITASTGLTNAKQFNHLVISDGSSNQYITRIQDIGEAELGAKDDSVSSFFNGEKTMLIGVIAKSSSNPLNISKNIVAKLDNLKKSLPDGMQAKLTWDSTKFIAESISEVKHTIIEATIGVMLVIFLFLGSFRGLLVTSVCIPLSIIGTFSLMSLWGFSLNTLTLLSIVLAIGMVVDDSIVVSENIHRHLEKGLSSFDAALLGAREIKFAIIAMTLTLSAVYAPIGFMSGLTGHLFREFAFSLAAAVVISGFISLTLSPMMCSKLYTSHKADGLLIKKINFITAKVEQFYRKALTKIITSYRYVMVLIIAIILAGIWFLYADLAKELAPKEDIGVVASIVIGPTNANLHYTEKYSKQVSDILAKLPERENYFIINGFPKGINSAISFAVLKPWEERKRSVEQIVGSLYAPLSAITGVKVFPFNPYSLPGSRGLLPIEFIIQTIGSYQDLQKVVEKIESNAKANPHLVNVDSSIKWDKIKYDVEIDRDKAASLGIAMGDISDVLNIAFGEPTVSRFDYNGRGYDVIPKLDDKYANNSDDIGVLELQTVSGEHVPLSNISSLEEKLLPRSLEHFQELRSASITASFASGYTLGEGLDFFKEQADKYFTPQMSYDLGGDARQFIESNNEMAYTFVFALVFIFLILSAQFESFLDPLIVMLSVPLSTFGALLFLKLSGSTINIYTEIGLVTLVGLISKHGILMVEFANQLQEDGKAITPSIIEAATVRLRPILMTTCAIILGSIPLVTAFGAGAISRSQMGWTIIGGMSIGTIFTLCIVPTMYVLLKKEKTIPKPL